MARILLADDEAATRDMVKRALAADGHDVVVTEDGQEALDRLLGGETFDLLLSDVQMPVLDGLSLVEKALAARPGLAVVLMSGHVGGMQRAQALQSKLKATITKPFTLDQIRAVVKGAL